MFYAKGRGRRWLRVALLCSTGLAGINARAIAASIDANDTASLETAILGVNAGTYDTINITGNITLSQELTALTSAVIITGNGNTISGNNTYRDLFIDAPSASAVNISNLTLANGYAVGGAGGAGAGGGLGAGGAIFAMSGNITLTGVTLSGNRAQGGAGGSGGIGFGGGGGLGGAGGTDNSENTMGGGGGIGLSATGGHASTAAGAGILPGGSGGAGSGGAAGGATSGGGGSNTDGGGGGGFGGSAGTSFVGGNGGFGGGGGGSAEGNGGNGGFGAGGAGGFFGTEVGGTGGFGGGGGGGQNAGGGGYGGGNGQASGEGGGGGGAGFGGTLFVCTSSIDSHCAATLTIVNSGTNTIDGNVSGGSGGGGGSGAAQGGALFLTIGGVANFNIAGGTTTITSDIAGFSDGGIVVTGLGELDLTSSASNYSGGTVVKSSGTLGVTNGASLGSGTFTLGSNGTTGTLINADTTDFTFSKPIALATGGTGKISGGIYGLVIGGQISGSGALQIVDGHEVDLTNGSNNWSGSTLVSGGSKLGLNLSTALGSSALTLGAGGSTGTLRDSGSGNLFPFNHPVALAAGGGGIIDGAGHIIDITGQVTGSGSLEIASSSGFSTVYLENATNSFTGTVSIDNNAELSVGAGSTGVLGSDVIFSGGNGTLHFDLGSNYTYSHNVSGSTTGAISVQGAGIVTLSGDNHLATGRLILQGGGFSIASDNNLPGGSGGTGSDNEVAFNQAGSTLYLSATNTFAHFLDLSNIGGTVSVSSGQTATWSGAISGFSNPTLTISGGGIFKPTSTSNGWGPTVVQGGGTLQISDPLQIGSGALLLGGGGSGTLVLGANSVLPGLSSITIGSGGGIIDSTGFSQNVSSIGDSGSGASRTLELKGGSLLLSGAGAYTGQTQIDSGATFQLGNGSAGTLASTSVVDNGNLYIDATTNPAAYSFAVSGNGHIQSLFYGSATLSGSSASFSGTLIAGANTQLSVTGNFSGASATQVMTGASLGGSGTVANVEIFGGGTLAPGDPTTTNVTGTLQFDSGSNYNVELDAGGAGDETIVTGNITLGSGNAALNITAGGAGSITSGTVYTILHSSGGTLSGDFSNATTDGSQFLFDSGLYFATVNYLSDGVTVTVTPGENDWTSSGDMDFATAGNWSLGFAPNTSVGATFLNNGAPTSVIVDSGTTTTGLTFASGAPAYTVSINNFSTLDLTGAGIVDNSSNAPSIFIANSSKLVLDNSASAGDADFTVYGTLKLNGSSSGSNAIVGLDGGGELDISGATSSVAIGDLSSASASDIVALGAKTLTVGGLNNDDSIAGQITGTTGSVLDKVGTGTLTLTHTNNSQAATTIENGAISIGNETELGTAGGALTLGNGSTQGTLIVTTGTNILRDIVINAGGGQLVSDNGSGVVFYGTITGTGALEIGAGANSVLLAGDASPASTLIDSGGSLIVGNSSTTGSISGDIADNGTLGFNRSDSALNYGGNITGVGAVTIYNTGTGSITVSGTGNTYSGLTTVAGTLKAGADGSLSANSIYEVETTGTLNLNNHNVSVANIQGGTATTGGTVAIGSGSLTLTGSTSTTFGGDITGSGTLALNGTALGLTLTANNDFTGGVTIAAGNTLSLGNGGSTGTIDAATYSVTGTLALNRTGNPGISGDISGAGEVDVLLGTVSLTGDNSGFTGNTVISTGAELDITASNQIPGIVTGGTGTLSVTANSAITYNNNLDVGVLNVAGSNVFVVTDTAADNFTGHLTGNGNLAVDASAGDFTFNSSSGNTFNGTLDVFGGIVALAGSLPAAQVTVEGGAELTMNNGSQIGSVDAKGYFGVNGVPATATVNGTVNLESSSDFLVEINDAGNASHLAATGNVTLAGGLDLTPDAGSYTLGQTFTVLSTSSTLSGHFSVLLQTGSIGGGLGAEIQYTGTSAMVKIVNGHVWTPGSSNFNLGFNWSSGTVPCSCEVAEFDGTAIITGITNTGTPAVSELLFDSGAPAFTITTSATSGQAASFSIGGGGIVDNSGHPPTLIADGLSGSDIAEIDLHDGSAGDAIFRANNAASLILLAGAADAGGAQFVLNGGGLLDLQNDTNATVHLGALSGNASGSAVVAGTATLTLAVGALNTDTTFDGEFLGSALTLQKVGTGTLTLTNVSNEQIANIVSGGTLNVNSDAALGDPNGDITLSNGGALQWGAAFDPASTHAVHLGSGGGTFDTNTYDAEIDSTIDGAGSLTKVGAGTLTLGGSNAYQGGTHINGGTLAISDDSNLGQSGTALSISGGTLELDGSIDTVSRPVTIAGGATIDVESSSSVAFDQVIGGTGGLTITGGGGISALAVTNADTYTGGTTIGDGAAVILGDGTVDGSIQGNVVEGTGSALIFDNPDPTTFAGNITTGLGATSPNGVQIFTGAVTLTGNNAFALTIVAPGALLNVSSEANLGNSDVTLLDGTLQFGASATFATSDIDISGDGILDTSGHAVTLGGEIDGSGCGCGSALTIMGGGDLTLTNASNSWTDGLAVVGGSILSVGNDGALGDTSNVITLGDGSSKGTLQFTSAFTLNTNRTIALDAGGGGIDTDGNAVTLTQAISGAGAFTKSGAGNLILSATEAYTGATTISGGTLSVNGNLTSSSGVAVNFGGTLGGTGTVSTVTVASGGNLAPGNSIGTLNIAGNLTLASGSTFTAEISPTLADKVLVSGTASIAGKLILSPTSGTYVKDTAYTLIKSTGALSGGFSSVDAGAGFGAALAPKLTTDGNDAYVTLIVSTFAWAASPASSDWNNAANWTSALVPGATNDAVFNASSAPSVAISQVDAARSLIFNTGAPAYSIAITGSALGAASLTLSQGITDASGKPPTITASGITGHTGILAFTGTGTAADANLVAGNFGTVSFAGNTDAGTGANLTVNSGGTADFSATTGTGANKQVNAGALSGTGGTVSLGSNSLSVGALNTSTTFAGTIADGGAAGGTGASLIKVGSGTLTLSGASTYTGGTIVSGGTLALAGSMVGNINDSATVAFASSTDKTFSALIFGTGAVVQSGPGTVTLSGTQTYTGATTVNAGTLAVTGNITKSSGVTVNSGGTLAGTGTVPGVSVNSGGTIAPGGVGSVGTLTIAGNLTLASGSTYAFDTATGGSDLASVSGKATVAGSLAINAGSGTYSYNQQIPVLVATGGVAGSFASSTLTGSFGSNVAAQVNSGPNSIYLTLAPKTITGLLPANAPSTLQGVASVINQLMTTQAGLQEFAPLGSLSVSQLETVLSEIAGNPSAGANASFNLGSQFIQSLLSPFQDSRGGGNGPALSFNAPDGALPAQATTGGVSFWGTFYGNRFVQGADAATAAPKSDSSAGGMMAGADYRLDDVSVVGAAIGYGMAQWNFGTGLGHSDGAQVGLFGSTRFDALYVSGGGAVFFPTVKNSRQVSVLGSTSVYSSTYSMTGYGGRLEAGHRFDISGDADLGLSPYLALIAQGASLPAYKEATVSGPNTFALNYSAADISGTQEELGMSLDHSVTNGDNNLSLEGRAGWVHDSSGLIAQNLSLQAFANSGFTDRVRAGDRDEARISLSARANLDNGLDVSLKGQADLGARTQGYSGNAYLSYRW